MGKNTVHFHCPVNGWDCPYYQDSAIIGGQEEFCLCTLERPYDDCSDFFFNVDPEDYVDYVLDD